MSQDSVTGVVEVFILVRETKHSSPQVSLYGTEASAVDACYSFYLENDLDNEFADFEKEYRQKAGDEFNERDMLAEWTDDVLQRNLYGDLAVCEMDSQDVQVTIKVNSNAGD